MADKVTLKNRPFVLVVWEDANGNATSEYAEEDLPGTHRASIFYSWGWKMLDDDRGITLVNEWYPKEESYRSRMFIPRGMIQKVIPLTVTKKKAPIGSKSEHIEAGVPVRASDG